MSYGQNHGIHSDTHEFMAFLTALEIHNRHVRGRRMNTWWVW